MTDSLQLTPQTADNLHLRIQALATLMASTAESLQHGEQVELQHLANELTQVQDLVQSVSKLLSEHPLLSDQERQTLQTSEMITACRELGDRQRAIDQFKRLQLVKSYEPADQEGFRQFTDQVSGLIQRLTSGSAEERRHTTQAIFAEHSPFRAVYELVNRPEELSDDRWLEAQRLITEAFGRNVALAVLRGRAR